MRTISTITLAAGALALGALGCAATEPGPPGSTFDIQVAPLEGGITEACYKLEVFATDNPGDFDDDAVSGNLVWQEDNLCSSSYGVNGQLRYVGVCSNPSGAEEGTVNAVRLTINSLMDGSTDLLSTGFINPCPEAASVDEDNGCVVPAVCKSNTDTQVEFSLTVMRQAQFGFLDVAVRFNEVFCSAKVDCERDDSTETLRFLQKPDGSDGDTVVVGFTCFAGTDSNGDAKPLYLYLDDITLDCGADKAKVYVGQGPGNLAPASFENTEGQGPILFGASISQGASMQGGLYVNTLLGMNDYAGCTLTTKGTASPTQFDANTTPANTNYPYIDFDVVLGTTEGRTCSKHPLFGTDANAGVSAPYTGVHAPAEFDNEFTSAPSVGSTLHATPAFTAPCEDHDDCAAGEGCYLTGWADFGQCSPLDSITFCAEHGDCSAGELCFDKVSGAPFCLAHGTLGPACNPGQEWNGAMCPAGTFCDGQHCREVGQLGALCDGQTPVPTCAEGLYCSTESPSVCALADVEAGEPCDMWSPWMNPCASGLACTMGICEPLQGVGGACDDDVHCQAGLICRGSDFTCQAPLANGQSCAQNHQCQGGACINGLCADDIAPGGDCFPMNGQGQCTPGFLCDAATLTCQAWVGDSSYCDGDAWCPADQTCVDGPGGTAPLQNCQ